MQILVATAIGDVHAGFLRSLVEHFDLGPRLNCPVLFRHQRKRMTQISVQRLRKVPIPSASAALAASSLDRRRKWLRPQRIDSCQLQIAKHPLKILPTIDSSRLPARQRLHLNIPFLLKSHITMRLTHYQRQRLQLRLNRYRRSFGLKLRSDICCTWRRRLFYSWAVDGFTVLHCFSCKLNYGEI